MAIKFRCTHCGQFLGIARSRAGKNVVCPMCGRTIRVPLPKVQPPSPPEPTLAKQDSQLVAALDELAAISRKPASDAAITNESLQGQVDPQVREPTPEAKPIPVEPLLPAVPLTLSNGADQPLTEADLIEPWPIREAAGSAALKFGDKESRRRISTRLMLAIAALCTLSFAVGYLIGARQPNGGREDAEQPLGNHQPDRAGQPNEVGLEKPRRVDAPEIHAGLTGRITYKLPGGGSSPDEGARVLVFPQQRKGEAKLTVTGLRAADSPGDFQNAVAGMRALGGDVARIDEAGNYEATLQDAGTYHVLVLSHYVARSEDEPIDKALQSLLEAYFDRPGALLGRVAYHFSRLRYQGEGSQILDHTFEQPQ